MAVKLFRLVSLASVAISSAFAFNPAITHRTFSHMSMSTIVEPLPTTRTQRRTKQDRNIAIPSGQGEIRGPLEWLIDDPDVSRESDDPFHILLLDETFVKNPRISVEYVASSCSYVLGMPFDDAAELARHAKSEGFSCLGTWSHDECLRFGGLLQQRDVVCRVVPYCEGGDRPWQARDASTADEVLSGEDFD